MRRNFLEIIANLVDRWQALAEPPIHYLQQHGVGHHLDHQQTGPKTQSHELRVTGLHLKHRHVLGKRPSRQDNAVQKIPTVASLGMRQQQRGIGDERNGFHADQMAEAVCANSAVPRRSSILGFGWRTRQAPSKSAVDGTTLTSTLSERPVSKVAVSRPNCVQVGDH